MAIRNLEIAHDIRGVSGTSIGALNVSVNMSGRLVTGNECLMAANALLLAFPDGRRSYINMNVDIDSIYQVPLPLKNGSSFRGYMAFMVPADAYKEFLLVIRDMRDGIQIGKNYFISLHDR